MPYRRTPVRKVPAVQLGPDFRGQLHEFPQPFHGEPALLLKCSQLQLALHEDFHDFVVFRWLLAPLSSSLAAVNDSNIRALVPNPRLMERSRRTDNPGRCRDTA